MCRRRHSAVPKVPRRDVALAAHPVRGTSRLTRRQHVPTGVGRMDTGSESSKVSDCDRILSWYSITIIMISPAKVLVIIARNTSTGSLAFEAALAIETDYSPWSVGKAASSAIVSPRRTSKYDGRDVMSMVIVVIII